MPVMTTWSDIVGYTCVFCGKWATHFYGDAPICCSCHLGYNDIYMEQQAIEMNTRHQHGEVIDDNVDFPMLNFLSPTEEDIQDAIQAETSGYLGAEVTRSLMQQPFDKNNMELLNDEYEQI